MRSNRTVQTIVQAITLVVVAAIFFRLPDPSQFQGGGQGRHGVPSMPDEKAVLRAYRAYFEDWNNGELPNKAELKFADVKDISIDGAIAYVKLRIEVEWKGHNISYTEGPLKNAPGQRGDRVTYTEVFRLRRWQGKGWDIEGRHEPPIIQ